MQSGKLLAWSNLYCTVKTVVSVTPFSAALIVVVPVPALVANPVALITATPTLLEVHVTWSDIFWVLPSLKFPVATNCSVSPELMCGFAGVIAIEVRVALVTLRDAVPTCAAKMAVMVAFPTDTPVATPMLPPTLLMVATDAGAAVHCTDSVRSCVLPFPNVPMAVNGVSIVSGTLAVPGMTARETNGDELTIKFAELLVIDPMDAVMLAVPADCPVTSP